MIFRQIYQNHH